MLNLRRNHFKVQLRADVVPLRGAVYCSRSRKMFRAVATEPSQTSLGQIPISLLLVGFWGRQAKTKKGKITLSCVTR